MRLLFLTLVILSLPISTEKSEVEISSALIKWSQDFNAKNIKGVCELFADNVIASYPNTPDRNYQEMCQHLSSVLTNPQKQFQYDPPKIEQIILQDKLAIVRLIWTLRILDENKNVTVVREKGLDVFKQQSDGSWKIVISYAHPITTSTTGN